MGKEKTEKSPYKSRYGSGWISPAQHLAENMCGRKARANGDGDLPDYFWNDEIWAKELKKQLVHVSSLLKKFDIDCIISALKHPDAKKIYSFGLKSTLEPLIKREQRKKDLRQSIKQEEYVEEIKVDIEQKPRVPFAKTKSALQKLRELD